MMTILNNLIRIKGYSALICGAAFVLMASGSCKGRTMENMEPTGDTVEVVIMNGEMPQNEQETEQTNNFNQETQNEDF